MEALVVGAGIGGLAAAVALGRAGLGVRVVERAAELTELGAGVTLQPNALRALAELGLAETFVSAGVPLRWVELAEHDGRLLSRVDLAGLGAFPAVALHRATLQRLLLGALAPGVPVRLGAVCVGVDREGPRPRALLEHGEALACDVLVGADGLDSAVRAALHGAAPPRYAGYTCWRGVCPADAREWPDEVARELWGAGRRFGAVAIDGGRRYWYATLDQPPGVRRRDLLALFAEFPRPVRRLIEATADEALLQHDIHDRPPLRGAWGRGGVTLLGDAAHPMTPNLGQGACQALEDAVVLAGALREVRAGDREGIARALRRYERRRSARTRGFVARSRRLGRLGQWRSPVARWLRRCGFLLAPQSWVRRELRRAYAFTP